MEFLVPAEEKYHISVIPGEANSPISVQSELRPGIHLYHDMRQRRNLFQPGVKPQGKNGKNQRRAEGPIHQYATFLGRAVGPHGIFSVPVPGAMPQAGIKPRLRRFPGSGFPLKRRMKDEL
jgi:hypothetical protein